MRNTITGFIFVILIFNFSSTNAQSWSSPLKVFGFFQASYIHSSHLGGVDDYGTFNIQQLNLFFQKDLTKNWTSFINFEVLNNFSSNKQWGSINLEEAWIKYYAGPQFTIRLGLQIPIFNNLNEIKNRTPLLPYIIRPLVYETSFGEFLALEEMTPGRAFIQTNGFVPIARSKIDYAFYIGNSPNINNNSLAGQTGIDTTDTYLIGGRVGLRFNDIKMGLSATYDKTNAFKYTEPYLSIPEGFLDQVQRIRLGGDFSFDYHNFRLESEFITVNYDDDVEALKLDKWFHYFTLGYFIDEEVFLYYSYWYNKEYYNYITPAQTEVALKNGTIKVKVPTVGLSYHMTERITFKGQFAQAKIIDSDMVQIKRKSITENYFSLAVSVFF
ncbi:MAG: hypothetical protein P8X42_12895 [Calditrichaceae bacterium]|jgi:hypothetical protein